MTTLACIVEGHGDVPAVRVLLWRLAAESGFHDLLVPTPIRTPKSRIIRGANVNMDELKRALEFAFKKIPSPAHGAVLVVLDADESCPARLAPEIKRAAAEIRADVHVGVVLAKHEFEAWFIAAMESLRGCRGIRMDAVSHPAPEDVSNAKGYLQSQMGADSRYNEPVDQPALADGFDMKQASDRCRSFRKMREEFDKVVKHLRK